ncbi:MAG TPA: hypothetical protein DDW52_00335 [Planctomycetaceae bacterium]|nr:hypothetical protein [Planctomycetaceae bacterium]
MPTHYRYTDVILNLALLIAFSCFGRTCLGQTESPQNPEKRWRALEQYALRTAGDAAKGKQLFLDTQRTKCGQCHIVDGKGGKIGPDLSSIGGKFDRGHLIESLLYPSVQIVEGYRTSRVLLDDGSVLKGVIIAQDEQSLSVADADAKQTTVPRAQVEEVQADKTSIMPSGLADNLTSDEFADLVAYLETLRSSGKSGAGSDIRGPILVDEGYDVQTIATGLSGGTALDILPDGRILVCEQTGSVRVIKDGQLLADPMLELDVDHLWERGIIGITHDPEFPAKPFIYVCYTGKEPYPHHRISKFRVDGDAVVRGSEQLLLEGDDQTKMGGHVPAGHQGGAMHFGIDGKLYIAIGEQTAGAPSQDLDTFLGKMLRINSDGSIPDDNPLLDKTEDKYQAIWTYGMRNPFTFAIRDSDGLMLINDVGGKFEEINVGIAGKNYGWPIVPHGPLNKHPDIASKATAAIKQMVDPIHWYPEASISGGDFLPLASEDAKKSAGWPKHLQGRYFFADFKHGWVHTIDPADGQHAEEFAGGLRRPVDLRFAPNGTLYVLLRNAWVIDDKFVGGTSTMLAIRPKAGRVN